VPKDGAHVKDGVIKKGEKGKREKAKRESKMGLASPHSFLENRFCGSEDLGRKGLRL
jgi:hypothetical protein